MKSPKKLEQESESSQNLQAAIREAVESTQNPTALLTPTVCYIMKLKDGNLLLHLMSFTSLSAMILRGLTTPDTAASFVGQG